MIMKYWGFLLLKLVAGAVVMRFVWSAIVVSFRGEVASGFEQKPFGHDLDSPAQCSFSSWLVSA